MFAVFFFNTALADTVVLKSGKEIQGKIIERTPDYLKIKYNSSEVYFENKYIKSIAEDNSAFSSGETNEAGLSASGFEKGMDLAAGGNFEEAQREFNDELADINGALGVLEGVKNGSISKQCAIYLFKGFRDMRKGNYQDAAVSLEKAWELNPKDPDINYNLGAIYFALTDFQKAIAYLFAALKLHPEDADAYLLLAQAYYNTGKYQEARESLLVAKKIFQKNSDRNGIIKTERFLQKIEVKP